MYRHCITRVTTLALFAMFTPIAVPTTANPNGVPTMNDSAPSRVATMNDSVPQTTGLHDFDFFMGRWNVHGRRLRERLKGSHEWIEIEATAVARPLLSGFGNEDEFHTDFWPGFVGMSFRFFDPETKQAFEITQGYELEDYARRIRLSWNQFLEGKKQEQTDKADIVALEMKFRRRISTGSRRVARAASSMRRSMR